MDQNKSMWDMRTFASQYCFPEFKISQKAVLTEIIILLAAQVFKTLEMLQLGHIFTFAISV